MFAEMFAAVVLGVVVGGVMLWGLWRLHLHLQTKKVAQMAAAGYIGLIGGLLVAGWFRHHATKVNLEVQPKDGKPQVDLNKTRGATKQNEPSQTPETSEEGDTTL